MASDGWNIAKDVFSGLGLGGIVNSMGDAIDKAVNPDSYKQEEQQQQYSPHGMYMSNIHDTPQSQGYYNSNGQWGAYPQNQNNNSFGFNGLGSLGSMFSSSDTSNSGEDNLLGMAMKFAPLLLAHGGMVGHRQHFDDGGYATNGLGSVNTMTGNYGNMGQTSPLASNMQGMGLGSLDPNMRAPNMSIPDPWQNPPHPANVPNGFSGMSPMFGSSQSQQPSQQFAKGGVANNFGKAKYRDIR